MLGFLFYIYPETKRLRKKLYEFDPVLFSPKLTGPFCQRGCCEEGAMSCGIPIPKEWSPLEIMRADYPLLVEGREAVYEN